ncbi:MAG TPA: hypothetical protein VJZ69_04880 [Clostridia bacterium]|nr:hypothetical protein [Clostridia bacterium]
MQFFGTDGIRGEADWLQANNIPRMLGRAIAALGKTPVPQHLREGIAAAKDSGEDTDNFTTSCANRPVKVAVARDVRLSSPQIEKQLLHGLLEHDAEVYCLGVLPTPALVSVSQTLGVDYSVMVTASHNPPSNNGLKVFESKGEKLSPEDEAILDSQLLCAPVGNAKGVIHTVANAEQIYIEHLIKTVNTDFSGVVVHLDCANGCTAELASKVFTRLNATVVADNNIRDGAVVNVGTGSTNMNYLTSRLNEGEIGFAFDGDGDRVLGAIFDSQNCGMLPNELICDNTLQNLEPQVKILDGDYFLLSLAMLLQKEKLLSVPSVVATDLSNGKLSIELLSRGITLERTNVGDKFVLDRMNQKNITLGGERSGHIIAKCYSPTGDGILSALLLLKARKNGICPIFVPFPQYELNVKVKDRDTALSNSDFLSALERAKEKIGDEGRILIRKSGTEPLIRLMCESNFEDAKQILTNIGNILQKV